MNLAARLPLSISFGDRIGATPTPNAQKAPTDMKSRNGGPPADEGASPVAYVEGGDAEHAAAELRRKLPDVDYAAIVGFVSPEYDSGAFAAAMTKHFPHAPFYGCTTAGELGPQGIGDGGVVAIGFRARDFSIVATRVESVGTLAFETLRNEVRSARAALAEREGGAERNRFGLLMVDGLCLNEEALISAIGASLDDIQVAGGSAGDGSAYGETFVFFDGGARRDAAVLLLVSTELPCRLFRCNSFEPTAVELIVTEADVERRIVRELNAEPAAHEYARVIGVPVGELNSRVFAAHPVIVRVGGDYYARSIQRANEDNSLTFFCAIDEGMVLRAAGRLDSLGVVEQMFRDTEAELGEVGVYIRFDCIYRRLDAEQRQILREMQDLYRRHHVVGFNTYGEQFELLHLNQTFAGVAIGRRKLG